VVDIGRAERELGWRPECDLARGLAETWEWATR
jgi:nucleoside-diphosphate-sugar epimerase